MSKTLKKVDKATDDEAKDKYLGKEKTTKREAYKNKLSSPLIGEKIKLVQNTAK